MNNYNYVCYNQRHPNFIKKWLFHIANIYVADLKRRLLLLASENQQAN